MQLGRRLCGYWISASFSLLLLFSTYGANAEPSLIQTRNVGTYKHVLLEPFVRAVSEGYLELVGPSRVRQLEEHSLSSSSEFFNEVKERITSSTPSRSLSEVHVFGPRVSSWQILRFSGVDETSVGESLHVYAPAGNRVFGYDLQGTDSDFVSGKKVFHIHSSVMDATRSVFFESAHDPLFGASVSFIDFFPLLGGPELWFTTYEGGTALLRPELSQFTVQDAQGTRVATDLVERSTADLREELQLCLPQVAATALFGASQDGTCIDQSCRGYRYTRPLVQEMHAIFRRDSRSAVSPVAFQYVFIGVTSKLPYYILSYDRGGKVRNALQLEWMKRQEGKPSVEVRSVTSVDPNEASVLHAEVKEFMFLKGSSTAACAETDSKPDDRIAGAG